MGQFMHIGSNLLRPSAIHRGHPLPHLAVLAWISHPQLFDGASVQPVAFEDTDHLRFYRDFFASLAHMRRAAPAE
jgi:hypothetical protein